MSRSAVFAAVLAVALIGGTALLLRSIDSRDEAPVGPPLPAQEPKALAPNTASAPEEPAADPPRAIAVPQRAIAGWVRALDGKPIWRARVRCCLGPYEQLKQTAADRRGWFCFEDLDPAIVYSIEASSARHAPIRFDNVPVGTKDLAFALKAGGRLAGFVYSASVGEPLKAFTVHLAGPEERTADLGDATGYFVIDGLPGGTYTARVSAPGYADSAPVEVAIAEGREEQRTFMLQGNE
jgi:hypothetical protein